MILTYEIHDLQPYINWAYYYYAWQLRDAAQQQKSRAEAEEILSQLDGKYHVYALFDLFAAHSHNDDIVITVHDSRFMVHDSMSLTFNRHIPLLRQQQGDCLCLTDFIHPEHDQIGVFATSVDHGLEKDFDKDAYMKMTVQLLADRLAEAAAEKMHEEVRRIYWGYAPDEHLTMEELHAEKFQGIRPAVGYPSLPDTSLNFVLDELIHFKQIGIRLTESGAMKPHASVSGLMIALPEAHYFSLGKIGEDQLQDYAHRRGLPVEVLRKFLASHL
ncbi:MAG: 5-methyltetrahydrofolate--homocysteine methyltransferase [Prevotella sp.]|nr:5-methyltetrahydrofolate--homocysteine methyltransferase [Prevotella sp.]